MNIKEIYIPELSQKVKVIVMSKAEIKKELTRLSSNISEQEYIAWVLEIFIPSVNYTMGAILDLAEIEGTPIINKIKKNIYNKVLKLNPLLNPTNLYIEINNTLTLTKGNHPLIKSKAWLHTEGTALLQLFDLDKYFAISEQARGLDHYIEIESWALLEGMQVKVRVFAKSLKRALVLGWDVKTDDEVKYNIVSSCIDSFHQICKYIEQHPDYSYLPVNKILHTLYGLAIKKNKFLDLTSKQIQNINKTTQQYREGAASIDTFPNRKIKNSLSKINKKTILNLEDTVLKQLFGQDNAVKGICNAIKRAYLGLKLKNKPIGAFLLYGPTSTGKTELAKILATELTNSTAGLVSIPCGTAVQGDHSIHTLIGAPPGYVGYEDSGVLAKALKTGKFKIILFDEVDKASSRLFDLVLEMLEEGRIMTADGEILDVSECLILFTSNIGQREADMATKSAGFEPNDIATEKTHILVKEYEKAVNNKLKPEFLARLNGKFYFKNLDEDELVLAAKVHLDRYAEQWKNKFILKVDESVYPSIIKNCKNKLNKKFHARDIKYYIDIEIVQKLGDFIIEQNLDFKKINSVVLKRQTLTDTHNPIEFIFEIIKKN